MRVSSFFSHILMMGYVMLGFGLMRAPQELEIGELMYKYEETYNFGLIHFDLRVRVIGCGELL